MPLKLFTAIAVVTNPGAGRGFVDDLKPEIHEAAPVLGALLTKMIIEAVVFPKGIKNKDAAMKFIALATSSEGQAAMAAATGYAPTNLDSPSLMDAEIAKTLPDKQTASQVNADMAYWAAHRDEIGTCW